MKKSGWVSQGSSMSREWDLVVQNHIKALCVVREFFQYDDDMAMHLQGCTAALFWQDLVSAAIYDKMSARSADILEETWVSEGKVRVSWVSSTYCSSAMEPRDVMWCNMIVWGSLPLKNMPEHGGLSTPSVWMRVVLCAVPSVSGKGSESTIILTRIKCLQKMSDR